MKSTPRQYPASCLLAATLTAAPLAAESLSEAAFDQSNAVAAALEANASSANLNAGTATGTWLLTGIGGGNPGAVIANSTHSDLCFCFDSVVSGDTTNLATGDSLTYSLAAGDGDADNANFSISGDRLTLITSADFETKPSYQIRIRATDRGGATVESSLTFTNDSIGLTADEWHQNHFGNDPPDWAADDDHDGLNRLLEYVLSSSPETAPSAAMPIVNRSGERNDGTLAANPVSAIPWQQGAIDGDPILSAAPPGLVHLAARNPVACATG